MEGGRIGEGMPGMEGIYLEGVAKEDPQDRGDIGAEI